nr:AAA family ATPase [Miniphocaeibacter massiliensis]
MMKAICVFNQKGGVGKTTTVVNLAAALGLKGKKVLVMDLDPQGNSSSGFGVDKMNLENTVYDLFINDVKLEDIIYKTEAENVSIIPSNTSLSGVEVELINTPSRESVLKNALEGFEDFDYIIMDCPPSLGFLSINALTAADSVLIPIQSEYYALEGVSQLVETINLVKKSLNKDLEVEGVLISMFDGRNNLSLEVVEEVKKYFKNKVFKSIIPRNVRLAEAPSYGESIFDYDSKSKGAVAYEKLAKEIIKNNK